jgi:hypothetical protein
MCVSVYANIVCAYYVHRAHDPAHALTIIQSHAATITTRRFTYSDLWLVAKTAFSDLRLVAKNF